MRKIYEDEKVVAVLCPEPLSKGHAWVMPKDHFSIIEQIPDLEIGSLFNVANKISVALFEILQAQGTNVFVQNGIAAGQTHNHFMINIIPRMPNDGINMEWKPKQLSQEEMSTIELKIKENVKSVGYFEEEDKGPIDMDKKEKKTFTDSDEENYMIRQLRKIP